MRWIQWFSCTVLVAALAACEQVDSDYLSIGTGGVTGVYYPTGSAICKLIQHEASLEGQTVRCTPEATGGSIFNLDSLAGKGMSMGIAQSDWQHHAYEGTSVFETRGANPDLRALFSMQIEPFTVVARKDANIEHWDDLRGKRVNIGDPGSGQWANTLYLMEKLGWKRSDFRFVSELKASEHAEALCDNRIDAFIYVVGSPTASIQEAATTCDVTLVDVNGPEIDAIIESSPFYQNVVIPGDLYRGNPEDTETFGLFATLVTTDDLSEDQAYLIVKAVFENLDQLKRVHPAFGDLTPERMVTGNSAPLHPGAERYYRENGLL